MEAEVLDRMMTNFEKLYSEVKQNRKKSRELLKRNQELQRGLEELKSSIVGYIKKEMKNNGTSLWKIAKRAFGKIDKRYYLMYSLLNKPQE